jgi:phytoene/squalene synthetase
VAAAYTVCRGIARREAKNFYYAFVALPLAKRNAICAIYAFMRRADDLADDESATIEERRTRGMACSQRRRRDLRSCFCCGARCDGAVPDSAHPAG